MYRYGICDGTGTIINVIIWDGQSQWAPPAGCRLIRSDNIHIGDIYDANDNLVTPYHQNEGE